MPVLGVIADTLPLFLILLVTSVNAGYVVFITDTCVLVELGLNNIYELQGGIMKWNAAGLSVPSDKIIGMCIQEYNELLKTDKIVLIDFYAEWCAPCKKMTPYLLKMQNEMRDKITIVRLKADENKTLISQMKIDELPMLFIYKDNKIVWKHSGYISEEDLTKQLQ